MAAARAVRDETSRELRRYRADVLAAHMPAGSAALCGALAGFLVFFVPLVVGAILLPPVLSSRRRPGPTAVMDTGVRRYGSVLVAAHDPSSGGL